MADAGVVSAITKEELLMAIQKARVHYEIAEAELQNSHLPYSKTVLRSTIEWVRHDYDVVEKADGETIGQMRAMVNQLRGAARQHQKPALAALLVGLGLGLGGLIVPHLLGLGTLISGIVAGSSILPLGYSAKKAVDFSRLDSQAAAIWNTIDRWANFAVKSNQLLSNPIPVLLNPAPPPGKPGLVKTL